MSRDLNDLEVDFKDQVEQLLANCRTRGYEMRHYFTLRTPEEQARLWRQSRTGHEIEAKIQELEDAGARYLAGVIRGVGPQNRAKVTDAPPGLSWNQWGEAVDYHVVGQDGRPDGLTGFAVYADEAEALDLTAGGHWRSFKDWPHVQLRSDGSPSGNFSLAEIDAEMARRFS